MAGKRLGKEHFDVMYSSDLKRTMDTAQAIYKHFTASNSPELIPDMRLREKGGGVLEGQPLGTPGELAKKLGISAREYRPEGGESWIDVNKRVQEFVKEIVSKYMHAKEKVAGEESQHADLGPTQESTGMMMGIAGHHAVLHSHQEEEKKGPSTKTKATDKKAGSEPFKILCVTHGGLIMEFLNFVDSLKPAGS